MLLGLQLFRTAAALSTPSNVARASELVALAGKSSHGFEPAPLCGMPGDAQESDLMRCRWLGWGMAAAFIAVAIPQVPELRWFSLTQTQRDPVPIRIVEAHGDALRHWPWSISGTEQSWSQPVPGLSSSSNRSRILGTKQPRSRLST